MNYIGSKHKLSKFIEDCITTTVEGNLLNKVFCDLFAGTGIVGRVFKPLVKQVISNDIEYYSYVLNRNYIGNHRQLKNIDAFVAELNQLEGVKGFIYKNYCKGGNGERQYFSDENGVKIDAIRLEIEKWKKEHTIDENLYYFLLASLLESADKVANTASVYGAYLKQLKKSAQKQMILKGAYFYENENEHQVFNMDSNLLIKEIEGDILYLDPPYNSRQYGANYHMLNTIAKYDNFIPKGKTGLREYEKSKYCSKAKVKDEFEALVKNAKFEYIFLSYNNEGLMPFDVIKEIMSQYGSYSFVSTNYQRFKADTDKNRSHKANKTEEFLHILRK